MKIWQLQDAKAKFSRLVDEALKAGPQMVTRHGEKAVVVIEAGEFERMSRRKAQRDLLDVLNDAPAVGADSLFSRRRNG